MLSHAQEVCEDTLILHIQFVHIMHVCVCVYEAVPLFLVAKAVGNMILTSVSHQ